MPPHERVNKTIRKELTPIERAKLIGRRDAGQTFIEIHQDTSVPLSTIKSTIKRQNGDQLKSRPRQRPRKTTVRLDRQIVREALKDRDQTLQELNNNVCPDITPHATTSSKRKEYTKVA